MKNIIPLSQAEGRSLQKLLRKKFRSSEGLFVVETPHLVEEALASDWRVETVVMTESFIENAHAGGILEAADRRKVAVRKGREAVVRQFTETVTSPGVFAVVHQRKPVWSARRGEGIFIALDGVSDPGNVGTIIRTADWFAADAVILGDGCAELYNPKVLRATMGSLFHLPVYEKVDLVRLVQEFRKEGGTVVAAVVSGGHPMQAAKVPGLSLLLFGSEAAGIRDELRPLVDHAVTIPRHGRAESLNVAISCGIILSHLRFSS